MLYYYYNSDQNKSPKRLEEKGKYANVYNELTDVGLPLDITAADVFNEPGTASCRHCLINAHTYIKFIFIILSLFYIIIFLYKLTIFVNKNFDML